MSAGPDVYLVARVREALAHDPRVGGLGIAVTVAGDKLLLRGDVATPERKAAAAEVVRPLLEGRTLENALTVVTVSEAEAEETIP